jgi:carboxyl-terminal processing protease
MLRRIPLKTIAVLMLGVVLGVGLTVERVSQAERPAKAESLPYDEFKRFQEIYSQVRNNYVEEVPHEKLIDGAIKGMLSSLDPHSAYLSRDQMKEMQVETEGQFGGLGIEVTTEDGFVKVVSPIEGTPAAKAGIEAGDLIIRLDDTSTKGISLMEAVKQMRGEPGTDITLTVVREGFEQPQKFTITRDVIHIRSVKSRMLDESVGYVRITQFQKDTGSKVREQVDELRGEADKGLGGLVLDLRNNPGGVLYAAQEVADAFVTAGKLVYTEGRAKGSRHVAKANPDDILDGAPIVVLVNGGSASASEIVAGALQDHDRGIVMGTTTFGKGSVQSLQELGSGHGLKLTTARYFTPKGRSIQAKGIEPDITVKQLKVSKPKSNGVAFKEKDLEGHLSNPNKKQGQSGQDGDSGGEAKDSAKTLDDYQLSQALNLLRGYSLMRR